MRMLLTSYTPPFASELRIYTRVRLCGYSALSSKRRRGCCRCGARGAAKRYRRDRRPGTSTVQRNCRPLPEGGRRVPRKMTDQYYCPPACRQRAHYWGYPVYSTETDDQD